MLSAELPTTLTISFTQWGSSSPNYDGNGNVVTDGNNSYLWNSRNQLASMNGGGAVFAYDSFGRRAAKNSVGNAKGFLYDRANVRAQITGN